MASKETKKFVFVPVEDGFYCRFDGCYKLFYTQAALEAHFSVAHPEVGFKYPVINCYKKAMQGIIISNPSKPKRTPPFKMCMQCGRDIPRELIDRVPEIMENHDCRVKEKDLKRKADEKKGKKEAKASGRKKNKRT